MTLPRALAHKGDVTHLAQRKFSTWGHAIGSNKRGDD